LAARERPLGGAEEGEGERDLVLLDGHGVP
jgi:hypothetical protein